MPIQKDPSGRRFIAVETEVPGTPEEVWQAIATGPGLTAWFVPSQLEEREKGSLVMNFGPGMESKAEIQEWDPPRRYTAENKEHMGGPGSPTMATEWTIEAKAGGTCRVRVVHSWFASTDDWDKQYEGVEQGWPAFFRILERYLAHFRGQPCTQIQLMAVVPAPNENAWEEFARPLDLLEASVGRSVKSSAGAPRFEAVVEHVGQKAHPEIMVRLDQPAVGTAHVSAMPMGGQMCLYACLYLYGDGARAVAAREEPLWRAWLARLFPSPVGQPGA
jgi:uncharacterized protein YndB with AHSA1/START domain